MRGEWDKKKDEWVHPLWLLIIFFSHGLSSRKMESTNTITTTKPKRQYKRKAVEVKSVEIPEIKPIETKQVEITEIKPVETKSVEIPEIKPIETKSDFVEVV